MRCRSRGHRLSSVGACLMLLAACANSSPEAPGQQPVSPTIPLSATGSIAPTPPIDFAGWRNQFRQEALAAGIPADVFDRAFAGIEPDPAIIRADQSQPEFTRPVWEYLESALSPQRLAAGRRMLAQHADILSRIEQRYGVDRHILVAIWGLESNFGNNMGDRLVVRSLATLAFEGRRPAFAHTQLIEALDILRRGDVATKELVGSWAGAMGQTQFIPSTYNSFAVDFDGDGRRDIWASAADALASAANYLRESKWQTGHRWGMEVRLPESFDYALADMSTRKTVAEWERLGVSEALGDAFTTSLSANPATLLLPAGHKGPAFLIMNNFRSILRYNNSSSYALAIGLMSERLQGAGEIQASWPTNDAPLSRSERMELQERLEAGGFEPGGVDGIIGANTRQAIRRLQQSLGLPADGYPTVELLKTLRQN
ncbi:MAG TPA: lytic murein transglycosylase [Pseudomonas xinjiangensis]|uniref:Lytic murein transglycosylase n=2 Tax=root TaxID=1 RepID=A0A7V1BNU5_9GAMM|nr:lytic murein transglycosylase [Halopseudomonas xinjiangensis]HEC47612.1 lytic murein transglycosylase [Halopseudomonas xinjiangensis]